MRLIFALIIFLFSVASYGQGNGLYAFVGKNNKYGFIDKYGNVKVKPDYLHVTDFNDGLCFVSKEVTNKGRKWICIDTIGNFVFDISDNFPETGFSEGFARISSFTEQWFVNKKGTRVFNKTWQDGQGNFKNGVAFVSDKKFTDFYPIDVHGNRLENSVYTRIEVNSKLADHPLSHKDALIKFQQDNLWGFKNLKGDIVIQPKFYVVDKFENGLCGVRIHYAPFVTINDYYLDALINTKGQVVNEIPMHCYLGFQGDLIVYYGGFHFSGGVFYLDKNGKRVTPKE
ncbi:WG repeat-containing protein [Mucilaginibacter auburnensis]|uniref:WG repeat protein n=1 Tax=Mucilaginibacter auburnensis TaxID=1457233 RepID=A0A2H9VMX4_9SPHI|nr:WG repeat-containing protein [Mucilaginibacter auburnensis]PJJ79687.1 WG repeat protein [Mucilaginibacter auburnensis]